MLNIPFRVVSIGDVEEIYPDDTPVSEVPAFLSRLKANAYISNLQDEDILVTADTVVILDNKILGKPADVEDAKGMLRRLSGRKHEVITGVTIASKEKSVTFSVATDVFFAPLSDGQIEYYVDNFLPLDKAGAYGIQEWIGAVGIERIDGSFYNVMGLPVFRLYKELSLFGGTL